MTQVNILLALEGVEASQIDKNLLPTVLLTNAELVLKLVDIPSTVLKSIPSTSQPPAYLNSQADQAPKTVSVDTWLVLSLGDGLIDIPLSADTLPAFEPPRSYLIPILPQDAPTVPGLEDKSSAEGLIRINLSQSINEDTLDTLDNILAGWTAYGGRHSTQSNSLKVPIVPSEPLPRSIDEKSSNQGRLAIVDEKTGEICGELASDIVLSQSPAYPTQAGKDSGPVMVSLMSPTPEQPHLVAEVSPAPPGVSDSKILSGAEYISRGILYGSDLISNLIARGGNTYISKTKAAEKPVEISQSTQQQTDKVLGLTQSALELSGKTVKIIGGMAGRVGDSIGKTTGIQRGPNGEVPTGARGLVHNGVMAIHTVLDSLETGGKKVLSTAGSTTTTAVTHSHGPQAGAIAEKATKSVQNVALVYIDARGITKKALLKTAGKAAIKGKMKDGREVIFKNEDLNLGSNPPNLPPPTNSSNFQNGDISSSSKIKC